MPQFKKKYSNEIEKLDNSFKKLIQSKNNNILQSKNNNLIEDYNLRREKNNNLIEEKNNNLIKDYNSRREQKIKLILSLYENNESAIYYIIIIWLFIILSLLISIHKY